jgi:hypothetical protein
MASVNLPITLGPAFWEKQKAALGKVPDAPPTKLGDELKTLAKLHIGIDWSHFDDAKLATVDAAEKRLAELEAAAKDQLKTLSTRADAVAKEAGKFQDAGKKKAQALKDPLAAAGSIEKAATEYVADVERFVTASRKALAARAAALAKSSPKPAQTGGAAKSEAQSPAGKIVRARALDAIRKARKPKPGASPTRFIVVQGKVQVATYLGPSVGPTQEKLLKSLIPEDAPYKVFKDPVGELRWEKNALTLVSDRLPTGLAKKMQLWLKKMLKMNLRLRVRKTTGEAEETEGEDIADDQLRDDEDDRARASQAAEDFEKRFEGVSARVEDALRGSFAAKVKALLGRIKHQRDAKDFDEADTLLDELEDLLDTADALEAWVAERDEAMTSLRAVAKDIVGARHASSPQAVIEIDQVLKSLAPELETPQDVARLHGFVTDDPVLNDVSELRTDIRTPLLRALDHLRAQMGG